jgi:hypothetical protein
MRRREEIRRAVTRGGALLLTGLLLHAPDGYAFELKGQSWTGAETSFHVGIPTSAMGGPVSDWSTAFVEAMDLWTDNTSFTFTRASGTLVDPCDDEDDRNGTDFNSQFCGVDWNSSTLAIEQSNFSGSEMLGSDIVFNATKAWSIYSGPEQEATFDFRRVAVHELGHTLGLAHEEDVPAIMSSLADDDFEPTEDDIAGAEFHYGDDDEDTIRNNLDNCRDDANVNQIDTDGDGDGDACDTDDDDDGVPDASDNCPLATGSQTDTDGDGDGDVCDDDDDNDDVLDVPVLDQQQTSLVSQFQTVGGDSPQDRDAQTVTAGRSGLLTVVSMPVACTSGDLTVEIQGLTAEGEPNEVVLATRTISGAQVPVFSGDPFLRKFTFSTPAALDQNEQFAIVLSTNGSCRLYVGPDGDSYTGGEGWFASAGNNFNWVSWSLFPEEPGDYPFQTFMSDDNCPLIWNPAQTDVNGNGIGDVCDSTTDTDGDGMVNTVDPDDDNDGMPDTFEGTNGLDQLNAADANQDADGDGFSNLEEFLAGTDPQDPGSQPRRSLDWLWMLILDQ